MQDKRIYELHADVCKALGHPLRIEVIDLLSDGEYGFTDILERTGGLKSNLSQHLSAMVRKGILRVRRDGKNRIYALTSRKVARACTLMREVLVEHVEKQRTALMNEK
ncbi:MAG: winged helix-turn-helix transcriptional regulator [Saprospiraceae bacterium]|jgi:DNA-binding transcriptional ArsR family regulator|nr:winged helix-turn-helix transcriptional regulator [Saprospiraceae bacterium]MBP9208802.1 winged helix-turn-helix transcriptional regulator [Saprospiraceae bacterium]MBV6472365.1 putative HTH-type transcriptional regulator [Saprospiraceae bacterium]